MKQLYFVRHGLSLMNNSGVFSGRSETPLHPEGKAQAQKAGQQLQNKHIDCIVASPMDRTKETASLIATVIGYPPDQILLCDDFIERDFGPLEGETYQPNLGDAEGVESIDELIDRVANGLAYLESLPYDTILLVSHGAVGRALRHLLHPEIPFRPSRGFDNGRVVQLL